MTDLFPSVGLDEKGEEAALTRRRRYTSADAVLLQWGLFVEVSVWVVA